jgi:autotransporter-associated beta strand protein
VDFAGGVFQWDFDSSNNVKAIISAGGITISDSTTFRLNISATLDTNTSGSQAMASLFDTVRTGADSLLLAESDTPVTGAMNWANLHYTINNGASWNSLTAPIRQGISQGGTEVAKGVFNWTAVAATGGTNELRVGYALDKIEVFKDEILQIVLAGGDPVNGFGVEITDYIWAGSATNDGTQYQPKQGSGSVLFDDVTGTRGIVLNSANSYTGTTTLAASTTLVLTNSAALGSATRHTVLLSATSAGATLNLNGQNTNVGGVQISNGAQIALNGGTLNILDNASGLPGVTATAVGGGTVAGNNALTGTGALNLGFGHLTVSGTNADLHGTGSIANNATASLDSVSGLGDSALNVSGLLEWVGATGTNLNTISGTGIVSATSAANVILGGSNSAFSGTWSIAADSALKATGSASLGAGKVSDSGTLTVGASLATPSDWTLNTSNLISGSGVLVKEDANTVTITHDSGTAGTLLANDGTLAFTGNGKFTTTGSAVNDSALALSGSAHLNAGTSYRQSAAATLTVDTAGRNATDNFITAGSAAIGGTLNVLNFASFNNSGSASGIVADNGGWQYILTTTSGPISGTFATVTGVDQPAQDYLYGGGQIINSGSTYAVGYGLRWYAADDTINSGTFTIGSGSTFIIDALPTLSGQAGVGLVNVSGTQFGWDGKSLTKLGEGTLTLSATNTYTGTTTVNGGVLAITGWTGSNTVGVIGQNFGDSGTVVIGAGGYWGVSGTLTVGGSGAGVLRIAQGGTVAGDTAAGNDRINIGSSGTAIVGGVLRFSAPNTMLTVGNSGSGALIVESTGTVYVGNDSRLYGYAGISGMIESRYSIFIGRSGQPGALVDINPGGIFTSTSYIVVAAGTVNVGGLMRVSTLTDPTNGYITIGQNPGDIATVNVLGSGSAFAYNYTKLNSARAVLNVGGTGYLNTGTLWAGGTVTVAGSGSIYASRGVIVAGTGGPNMGVVTVSDTGYLRSGAGFTLGQGNNAASLAVSGSGLVTAGGAYAQNAQSSLTLDVAGRGLSDAFVYANTATVGGTLAVTGSTNISGTYATASAVANSALHYLVTATGGAISGTFATITVNGTNNSAINAALPDSLYGGVFKTTTGTSYVLGTGLRWLADAANGSGTFTIGSGSTFTVDLTLSDTMGAATYAGGWDGKTLTKAGDGLLLVTSSNTFSGGALVNSGTLELRNLYGAGSGTVTVSATGILELSGTGAYANHTTGSGTAIVSGSVNLTGSNSIADWLVTGNGLVTSQTNLGNGVVTIDGGNLTVSASTWNFSNSLTGDGTLTVDLTNGGTFNFANSATNATAFSGTVDVQSGFFQLDNTAAGVAGGATSGTGILRNATLSLGASGTTLVDSGTYWLGGLALDGGVLQISMADAVTTGGTLTVGDLSAPSGAVVQLDNHGFVSGITPAGQDFFGQDEGDVFALLVAATGNVNDAGAQLALQDFAGNAIGDPNRVTVSQNGGVSGTATYDYIGQVLDDGTHQGLYVTYGLSELSANSGTFIRVSNTSTSDTNNRLVAKLTGGGGFEFSGSGAYHVGNATSNYTGSTHIVSGTFVAYSNNATGSTSLLDNDATFDLNGKAQTVGALDNSGVLNFNNGALTISGTTGNSTSTGTLSGGGALIVQSNTLTVGGSNNTTVSGTINNGAAIVVNHVSGLGTGAITDNGAFIFNAATGTNLNAIAGTGLATATNAANVVLGGSNANFSGTWSIAAGSALKAVSADSLGAGAVSDSGTLTVGASLATPADWTLDTANLISGTGVLVKEDTNTITISHSNAYTGNTLVNAGTLSLTAQNAIGTGTANVAGVLDLALGGTFANNTIGTGTAQISGAGVAVAGTNNSFTGAWNVTGSGTMTAQENLGASGTTKVNITSGGNLALVGMGGDYTFNQQLSGPGNLLVNNTGTFGFGAATGTAFSGTVQLQNNTFTLSGSNLVNATLNIDVNNKTTVATGTQNVGNLTLTSGTIAFTLDASGTAAAGIVNTGTLSMSGSTVVMVNTASFNQSFPLLQQDEHAQIQLIAATAHTGAPQVSGSNLVDHNGNELTSATQRDIIQNSATTASGTYNFAATVSGSGLWLGYELVALELLAGRTTVLNGDLTSPLGADELHAVISGGGNLQISASSAITLNGANSYSGTTFVTGGTLVSGTGGALGNTAQLAVSSTAAFNLNSHAETVGSLDNSGLLNFGGGALTIGGGNGNSASTGTLSGGGALIVQTSTLTVSGSNSTTVSTTINNGAAIVINNVSGLGAGSVTDNGLFVFNGATGTNANTISGGGLVSATSAANVVLGGGNSAFSGTWAIAADSALKATGSTSLGTGKVSDSGTLTVGASLATPADWTLNPANIISGSGALVKADTNTVTISHSNSYTGSTLVNAGTLSLTAQNAIGTGTANVAGVLDLALTGTFGNAVIGTGTARLSGAGVSVTGTNNSFTGAWNVTGSGTMTAQQNLGASGTTKINIASDGNLALVGMGGDYTFNQQLSGAGNLLVSNSGAFGFGAATGTAFSGTVQLQNNTFTLSGSNLVNAMLNIDVNNKTTVATGTQNTGNLTLTSGTIAFTLDASGTAAAGIVNTGTLSLSGSTVVMIDTGSFGHAFPLLQQDESRDIQLIAATAHTGKTLVTGSNLVDQNGNQITDATQHDIVQNSATTASGTYNFAATVSDSGLSLGYELVALDLLASQTTVLDHETAFLGAIASGTAPGGHELHAVVSGSGHLQISASSAIWLNNGNNSYTGTTFVTGGTLVTGNSGALGTTSLLSISATAAADLNATAQTVGALANAGALNFNGGTLTVQNGGTSGGVLDGTGALALTGGTLSITTANPTLAVSTSITAGAVADLKHAASLGTGAITADGTLRLDIVPANSGTLANALSGSGTLIKSSSGTVAIATANSGFAGSARVQGGRLLLEDLMALNAAGIDVDPGATLEYRNVSGTLANTVNGTGTLAIANSGSFAIAHDNTIANTVLTAATVYLSATHALGSDTASVRADNRSAIYFDLDQARLGQVTLEGAKLGFTHSGAGLFKTGTVASLAGSGTLAFNVDFTDLSGLKNPGEVANHLAVTGNSAGAFTVNVNALGGEPGSDETAIPLITDLAGAALYRLEGEKITLGLSEFEFANGAAADSTLPLNPGTWYLYSTGLSQAADAIIDTAALLAKDWHYSLDALYLRMGDVRAELFAASNNRNSEIGNRKLTGNVWVRSRGYRLNADNVLTGRGVEQYAYGATAGGDNAFETESGVNLLGAFIDMGRITRDFGRNSDGETGSASVGLYGTMLKTNGWHADLVLKADRYKHNFEVSTVNGRPVRGRYNSEAYGVSLEVGRRLERADGWWVEPMAQAAVARLTGASYRTTPANVAIAVKVDDATAAQYRGLVRFGRQFRDTRWTPYGKFGVVRTDTDGGEITAHERRFDPAALGLDGWRVEFGFGTGYRINDLSQLYLDYEYARAAYYERPWALNLGYRRLW